MAIEGYGITISGATFGAIGAIKEGTMPGIATNGRIDTTIHNSPSDMMTGQASTLHMIPPVTVTVFMLAAQWVKIDALGTGIGLTQEWTFTDTDTNAAVVSGWIDNAEPQSNAADGADAIEVSITFEFTGAVVYTAA